MVLPVTFFGVHKGRDPGGGFSARGMKNAWAGCGNRETLRAVWKGVDRVGICRGDDVEGGDGRATEESRENVAARDALALRPERQDTRRRRGGAERLDGREA